MFPFQVVLKYNRIDLDKIIGSGVKFIALVPNREGKVPHTSEIQSVLCKSYRRV